MKILKSLGDDLIPLSRKQSFILGIIVACFFQFVLFYAPALADDAVNRNKAKQEEQTAAIIEKERAAEEEKLNLEAEDLIVANNEIIKSAVMDAEAAKIMMESEIYEEETREPEYRVIRTSVHAMTAYNSEVAQTDDTPCITANGFDVCEHGIEDTIAANFLKFGTKVRIPDLFGDRIFVVRDRMNKRYPDRVDIWMLEKSDALQFGVRRARIEVVVENNAPSMDIAKK